MKEENQFENRKTFFLFFHIFQIFNINELEQITCLEPWFSRYFQWCTDWKRMKHSSCFSSLVLLSLSVVPSFQWYRSKAYLLVSGGLCKTHFFHFLVLTRCLLSLSFFNFPFFFLTVQRLLSQFLVLNKRQLTNFIIHLKNQQKIFQKKQNRVPLRPSKSS